MSRLRFALIAVAALCARPAGAGPMVLASVLVQPANSSVGVGQTFTVDISITGVSDLYAWQFDLGFDPTVLSANSIVEGPFLATGGTTLFDPGAIDNLAGDILLPFDTLFGAIPGVTGSGVLATVSFTSLKTGTSPIDVSGVILLDSNFGDIPNATADGSVTSAAAIPEPGTLFLFGSGLALLVRMRRQRRP